MGMSGGAHREIVRQIHSQGMRSLSVDVDVGHAMILSNVDR